MGISFLQLWTESWRDPQKATERGHHLWHAWKDIFVSKYWLLLAKPDIFIMVNQATPVPYLPGVGWSRACRSTVILWHLIPVLHWETHPGLYTQGSRSVYLCGLTWGVRPQREALPQDFAQSRISHWSPGCLSELYLDLWAREGPSYKITASNCNLEKLWLHITVLTCALDLILLLIKYILVVSWF